jgi:hypothetical protein
MNRHDPISIADRELANSWLRLSKAKEEVKAAERHMRLVSQHRELMLAYNEFATNSDEGCMKAWRIKSILAEAAQSLPDEFRSELASAENPEQWGIK